MTIDPADPRQRAPVLTDVIDAAELASLAPVAASVALPALPPAPPPTPAPAAAVMAEPAIDMAQVLARLEVAVQARLEARLEAVIEPLVARWSERLLNDAKASVAAAAREVVQDVVAEEMSRHRAG